MRQKASSIYVLYKASEVVWVIEARTGMGGVVVHCNVCGRELCVGALFVIAATSEPERGALEMQVPDAAAQPGPLGSTQRATFADVPFRLAALVDAIAAPEPKQHRMALPN